MNTRTLAALATLAATTACTPMAQFGQVLPDDRIEINLKVDEAAAAKDATEREWSEAYLFTARTTRDVNALIGGVLVTVAYVAGTTPASSSENHAEWGPFTDPLNPTETRLVVDYDPASDTYAWTVDGKPKGEGDEAYLPVVVGEVDAGATHDDNSGRFTIDFATMSELDPNTRASGTFTSDYDLNPADVSATATFDGFVEDSSEEINAVYAYDQTYDGEGAMDLSWLADVDDSGVEEDWTVHSRWSWEGAGRSDAKIAGGDLEGEATANECWNTSFEQVYRLESWSGLEEGDAALCSFAEAAYVAD
jgi:hypothetical protein